MSKVPKYQYSEGLFPKLGQLVSGAITYPLDLDTVLYTTLLTVATWDFEEEEVFVDFAELELTFCTEDAQDIFERLLSRGWATSHDDRLVLARIQNARVVYPFMQKKPTSTPINKATGKRELRPAPAQKAATTWETEPEFEELRDWLYERHTAWNQYMISRSKEELPEQVRFKVQNALSLAHGKKLTNYKLMDYFYGVCAMYFEWTDAPADPPAADFQAAKRLVKSADHWTLVQMVPFWLENAGSVIKGKNGDSLAQFAYFYNQLLTLRAKSNRKSAAKTKTYAADKL